MDQGYFLLTGLAKVRGEFSLTVLAYNLKRLFNLVGVPGCWRPSRKRGLAIGFPRWEPLQHLLPKRESG